MSEGVELVIVPPSRDIGGFSVRRALPSARRRMVGPFIFFDQMGPEILAPGRGLDVRPHPHIGLSTVTYLFSGEMFHRDSLGSAQAITPGAVNWMTAGRGIVHSERSSPEVRERGGPLFGIQAWVALPKSVEERSPFFDHHPAQTLPEFTEPGVRMRLLAGSAYGQRAPVQVFSELFYLDVELDAGARLQLPREHEERALYTVKGEIEIEGEGRFDEGRLVVLKPGPEVIVSAPSKARLMLLGGAGMDGPRYIHWNFVSSRRERLEQAKEDWREQRMGVIPGDSEEFIPLPEDVRKPVDYP